MCSNLKNDASKLRVLICSNPDGLKYISLCVHQGPRNCIKVNDVFVWQLDARDHYSWVSSISWPFFLLSIRMKMCDGGKWQNHMISKWGFSSNILCDICGSEIVWSVIKVGCWWMATSRRAAVHKYEMWGLLRAACVCGWGIGVYRMLIFVLIFVFVFVVEFVFALRNMRCGCRWEHPVCNDYSSNKSLSSRL